MGIQGLLPLLKSIHKPCSLKQFSGQTIGVDAYGWLHRGTVACAMELALDKPTTKFVDFAMSRVRMLKHFGVTPYIVFDGDYLPSKSKTEKERAARRKESKAQGLQLLELGKSAQAYQELQKAVDVTPEMAGQLIEELKRNSIEYVVAPYEADSQLVYLERKGIIDGILSEDSDLLVFGARRLLTKLDQYGECIMIRRDDFTACREVSLVGWTDHDFRRMAIMSGCDYLASIGKMGLKTAYRLIRKHKSIEKIIRAIQFDGKFKVPPNYLETFTQAERTFLYQWVFCPVAKGLVNFTPLEDGLELKDLPFIGANVESSIAEGVARGRLHPHTKLPLQVRSAPPGRGYASSASRASVATTSDLKGHKPINSFFKPKRIPLAELDPNVFQGSPEQQALARRASGTSWPATPVPQSFQAGRSTTTPKLPASAPVISRRAVSHNAAHMPASDRATKRQRLCDDEFSLPMAKDSARAEYGKSKFFGGTPSAVSPSERTKGGKRKDSDFNLWSDDSIEGVLMNLPDSEAYSAKPLKVKKQVEVFAEVAASFGVATVDARTKDQESQETNCAEVFSQRRRDSATPPSSIEPSQSNVRGGDSPFDAALNSELKHLREKFSYARQPFGSMAKGKLSRTHSAPVRGSTVKHPDPKQGFLSKTRHTKQNTISKEVSLQPTVQTTPQVPTSDPPDHLPPHVNYEGSQEGDPEAEINDLAWQEAGSKIIVPASDEVDPPNSPRTRGPKSPGPGILAGSEDMMVSESEVEDDVNLTPKRKPCLDFGRFAFAPQGAK